MNDQYWSRNANGQFKVERNRGTAFIYRSQRYRLAFKDHFRWNHTLKKWITSIRVYKLYILLELIILNISLWFQNPSSHTNFKALLLNCWKSDFKNIFIVDPTQEDKQRRKVYFDYNNIQRQSNKDDTNQQNITEEPVEAGSNHIEAGVEDGSDHTEDDKSETENSILRLIPTQDQSESRFIKSFLISNTFKSLVLRNHWIYDSQNHIQKSWINCYIINP